MGRHLRVIGEHTPAIAATMAALRAMDPVLTCDTVSWAAQQSATAPAAAPTLLLALAAGLGALAPTHILDAIRACGAPAIVVLADDAPPELLALVAKVADDFLLAPIRVAELSQRIARLLAAHTDATTDDAATVKQTLAREMATVGLVGQDPAFLQMLGRIPLAARSPGPVLIVGETGTGKELCARAIHSLGPRAGHPFIPADCTTLPDYLFENEMFGHVSGAYTDARRDQKGLVALADGGTLFLDEINSLSLIAQAKLLRFLETRSYRALGSSSFAQANLMIVAASNCDLQAMVARGQFRADLFFRLNVIRIPMVPLRDRPDDIALLAQHLLARFSAESGQPRKPLSAAALRALIDSPWPGNVRELANTLQRALLFSNGPTILPEDLSDTPQPQTRPATTAALNFRTARSRAVASFERRYVEDLMRACGGNVSQAARLADKDRRAFGRLVKRYDVPREFC